MNPADEHAIMLARAEGRIVQAFGIPRVFLRPRRLQRKRSKGWRKPEGSISVTRPGRWGNPFKGPDAIERFRAYAEERLAREPAWLEPLRGRDLLCWCAPSSRCHADVLLELAARR